ncbi:uncharacterized protein isoform X8 [Choristoneura fumiferana]|uniref:uncharacterized protein isoform X8 n=1 Tax=Choristoneura fumiferana TaxID=7141 RepID=UPI003D15B08F
MEPPAFRGAPQTVRAAPGAAAVLQFPIPAGTPPFHYQWSRAGASLDERFVSSDDAGGVRLTVTSSRASDGGVYTLQASNAAGSDTARVRLEIAEEAASGEDPPTFLRRLQDLTVKVGTRTRFLVEIVSSTECKVTWYRNERRLMEAERVSLVRDGNFWCADVAAVSVDDAGRWTCAAENAGGRASCSAHLNVLVPKAYKRPEFVEELRAILTEQGTVSLECKVIGVPTPVLRWFKDSREIKAGDVFALTASAEDPTSLGTYTCEAVNCMGRTYSSSKVHVTRGSESRPSSSITPEPPPIFTKELEDQFVRICEHLSLGCHIVVPPWPRSVVWYNKEGKVEAGDRYHVTEDGVGGYLLEVQSAEWPDEGEWKCVATSAGGRVGISTCHVVMDVPKNYRKPRFMENLQAVLTEEGLVSFECKVVGFPTPVLSWFKDGQELKPGDVYQLTGTNSLGSYCCIARNCMGQASSSAELTVEDIQNQLNEEEKLQLFTKNQAPKFVQGLKSVEAKIDEPFRFTIKVAIPPEPSVLWYRDDQPVDESNRCHLSKEDRGVFTLDIQNLEFLDQAEWKCVAMNDFGHSVTSCFLKLIIPRHYKKPRFLENLQAILSEEGAVNLECKVIGVPQPVLKWYKDGEELKPGDIHRIISGQDGTCCLGTYTCEAQNCMGIAASSASLLGFDDSMKTKKRIAEEQALQRNLSLSTIHEERTSQMYDTPVGDITLDDKGEISFSFDGKEVSVSLYETPDLTEEEALQIVEMYADQLSENVTEHNVVELPPLRFVKETSTSGNLLMEAIIIDVSPEYFASPEEDLRTEADVEDLSIADENGVPQLSLDQDVGGEDYLEKTMALLSEEKADIPKKISRKKSDSLRSGEDFFSLSRDQSISEEKRADDTQVLSESDLQSFASARSYDKQKSKSSKPSLEDDKESSETKTILHKEEVKIVKETKSKKKEDKSEVVETKSDVKEVEKKRAETETPVMKPKRERRGSRSSRRSSSGSEKSYSKAKEELIQVKAEVESKPKISDDEFKTKINEVSSTLSKVINDVQIIERDIILKSELMSSAATASRSLEIISNLITPLSEIQSVSEAAKECKEIKEVSSLFNNLPQSMKALQQSLNLVEKCIDMEGENKTLVKKTCIAFIETCGNEIQKVMSEINSIAETDYLQTEEVMIKEVQVLTNEMNNAIKYSSDTIKTRSLLSEASEVKTDETSADAKHLKDTQKAVFELRSPLNSLLCIAESADSEKMVDLAKIKNSEVILNDMSASIQDLQTALEQIESLSVKESMSSLNKYNTEIIETVMDSVLKLRISFENLSTETKIEDDKAVLKKALASIKQNLSEISTHIDKIESNIGNFDILQSDNKLEVLQKMAQILIALENNLPYLETIPEVKLRLDIFHKNLTKVLENVIETNEAKKYFALIEICDVVNRINTAIKTIHSDRILSLASLNNTLRIVQDHFINNVFDSELNCAILTNITDALVDIQETINQADEISVNIDSEHIQDIQDFSTYGTGKANVVLERIEHTIVAVSNIKLMECTTDLKEAITPALENICPVLEKLKQSIASIASNRVEQEEHVSDISDVSVAKTLATPLCELNQNIMVINQTIVENIESLKENSEVFVTVAEPLRELHTTLEILQQVVISQYGEDVTPYDVSVNIANAVQNLQSCIVMIREQGGIEFADEMSTLEDISGIKTTADTLPSDRLILPTGTETRTEQEAGPFHQDLPTSATAQALQSLNDHITVLQNPEIIDALDTLSEVSDYSSLKSVVLGLGELHSGIQELLHPFILETSNEITSINTSKLMAIAEPLQDLQQCLSVLDATNIPIYEHILEMPTEKIHSVFQSITEFKDNLDKCIHVVFPAMDNADKTIEISNKVETLRVVCEHLKDIIENTKAISTEAPVKQEVIALEETVKNLLDATDVSKGIKIEQVKCVTQELYENVTKVQEELIQFTPQTPDKLAQEAKLIQIIDKVERNIAVLEEYDFVDLSRASDMSCASPQIAVEVETDTLLQMDDVVQCAVGIIQDSSDDTPVADLMIVEDFFKNCRNEFALLRCLLNNKLSHKRIIRLLQEFSVLKQTISDFKIKQTELHLADDISNSLITFFGYCDDCLNSVQESLIKIVDSQADLLFKAPITKLENTKEVLSDILVSSKFTPLEDVAKRFVNVIDIAGPCLQRAEVSIRDEIKNNAIIVEDKALITAMDDAETFVEEQILTKSELTVESREILQNILDCIQKHHDYKDAVGSGKTLILLKCLSECSDILQEKITETKAEAKVHKFEDTALKVVLAEMLVPLQALHHQLINVQEQVLTGVEDDVSIDLTSTESFAQAMGEIQQEIKQLEQHVHEGTVVDSVEKTMILEIDKEIHTIQDSIRSIDNVNSAEKEKVSKPMEEIEKSLHTLLATEAERKQDIDINSNVDSLESALNRSLAIDKASVDSLTSMTGVNLNEIIEVAQELKKLIQDKENPKFIENKNEKIKNLESLLSQFDWVNSDSDKLKEYDKLNDALLTMYQLLKACNVDSKIVEAEEEKPTEIIQHVDKCIELIEIVEEISTIINLDNIKESANLAKELRENVASVEIEINKDDTEATKNVEKLKEKNVEIAIKLKDALASVQVQVLESTKELQPELKSEVVQRIQEATAQLQADFVNVDVIKSVTEQDSKTEQFEIELAKKDSMTTALEVQQDKGEKQAEAKTITQDSQKSVDHTEIDKIKDEETERKPVFQGIENVSDTKQDSVIYEKVVETEVAKKICSINEIESKSPVIVESFEIITTEQLSTVETCVSIVVEGKSVDTKDVTEAETAQEKVSKEEAVPVQIKEEKATVSTAVVLLQRINEYLSEETEKTVNADEINNTINIAKELRETLTSETVEEAKQVELMKELHALVLIQSQNLESADTEVAIKLCEELDSVLNILINLSVSKEIEEKPDNVDIQNLVVELGSAVIPEPDKASEVKSIETILIEEIVDENATDTEDKDQDGNLDIRKDIEVEQTEVLEEESKLIKAKPQNETNLMDDKLNGDFESGEPLTTEALVEDKPVDEIKVSTDSMASGLTQQVFQSGESNDSVDTSEQSLLKDTEANQSVLSNIIEQTIENRTAHQEGKPALEKDKDFDEEESTHESILSPAEEREEIAAEKLPVKEKNVEENQAPNTSGIEPVNEAEAESITEISDAEICEDDVTKEMEKLIITQDKLIEQVVKLDTVSEDFEEENQAEETQAQEIYSEKVLDVESTSTQIEPIEVIKAEEVADELIQTSNELKELREEEAIPTVELKEAVAVTEVEVIEETKTDALTDKKEDNTQFAVSIENAVLVQHIEELISPQVTKAIELVSKVIDVTEIKESIAMAKELKEILSEVVKETSNEDIVQEQAKLVDKLQEAFVAFQAVALENAEAIEKKLDASEWKAVTEVVVQLKDDLSKSVEATAVDENAVLVQHIEELISPQVTQSIELASKVIDVTEIKESIAVAKELKESLSEVVKETANEDIVKEQAKLKGKLQEALVAFQAVAVENAEAIEKKLDASEWKAVTEVVVQLRDDLLRGVEATVVSENAVLVQHIEELISPQVTQSIELASKVIDVTEIKESIAVAKELKESLSEVVKETANEDIVKEQAKLKGKLQEALVAFQAVAVENAEAIEKKLDASEWKAVTEVVVQLQDDLLRGVEATVVSENAVLVQHIEELISPQVTQSIELASKVIDVTEIKESIAVAKELKESLSEVVKETANEDIVKEQAKLKGKLQEALVAFQAVAVENAEAIEKKLDASEWKAVTEVVVQLQDDLSRGVEATVIAELPTEKTEASLNHLETLLQEVTISIGTERTTDDTESLRDNLDEIQTVIIKLKRDYDGANDTLNETLEDLECSVRSVQLQINEDSPPEMLKEACATLQLLVNNMSSTEDISGTVVKEIKTENLLEKCSNDTEATVQLLNIAMRDNKQLEKIVANLNVLRDIMKNLRSSFLNDADTLIDRGIEVLQSLDQVEEKVFALEKDIGDIPGSVKDSILNAVHSVYGSISNMRSTVQSIQKRYMFENYGKPSEEILKSIKNVTKADGDKKWKTLAKSLRKVLNHFEDIKFYINLDKTARLPSDAAFTKIILNELKMILNESVKPFSDDHSKVTTSYKAVLNCLEENLAKIESLTSLEVKEKIPVLKAIAPLLLKMTYTIATCCEDNNEEDILIDVNKLPELNKEKASEIENQGVSQQIEAQVKDKLEIKTELSEGKVLDTEKEPIETQQELTNSEKQVTKKTELIIETQKAVDDQNSLQLVNQSSSTDTKVSETVEMQLKTDNTTNKEPSVTAKEQKNAADLTEEKIPQEREEISKEEVEIGKVSSETDERNEISTEVESKYEQPSTSQLLISQKDTKLTQQEKLETVEKERDGIETKKKKDDKQAKVINHDENELAKGSKETKDDKIKISTEREEKTTETLHQQEGDITVEKEEIIVDRQTKDEENEQVKADVTEILKVQQEGAIGALVENQKEIEEAQIIKLKEEEAEVSESKAKKQEEGAKVAVEKQKQEEKAKIDKQNKEKEAKIENQNEAKKAEAQKQIEEEEINAKTKERNEADANKFKDKEDSKETEQKEKNKANAKKHKEEEETKSKIQKEDTESVSKKQAEKEEAKITNQKEEEEKAAKVKKEKEDEITTKKLKEEEEAKTKNHKEEEAPSAIKQKEEDNRATKQADEEIKSIKVIEVEETTSKKLEEKEEALVLKQKEEDTTKTRNQKDDEEAEAKQLKDEQEAIAIKQKKEEEEAKAIKLKEDELKASSFKEEQEADAAKLKEEQEAKAKKQKQEEEAKAIKQKEETEAKKHKEEQEAKTKKQKEEEEAKVKKQKEEEEVKAIKQKEEEEAIAKKLKEEQEAKAEKQKEEEEAKIKKQKEEEAEAKKQIEEEETKAKKQKEKAEAKKLKEGEELENNKQKEEEEVKAKEKKEEEENKAKKLKKKKEANAKIQKEEEEAKLNKQKEEEEANALKQNEVEAKKLKEEQEAVAKKQKEEEEENNKNQKEEEEAKAIKQKDEEERQAQKLKEEQEAKAKKQKEEEAKAKKQKEEEEAKAKKLKEEEETIAKKLKEEQDTKVKKQKEEEEAKVKEQKEEAEIKAKKQKEEKEAEAKKQKDEEEAKIKKQKEEKDAKAVKQKEEEGLKAKKLKEEQEAKAKKQKEEEEAKVKKQKEEEEAKAIKQKEEEELQAKELKDKQEAKAKKQKEEEAKAKKQKEEEEAKAKKLSEEEEAMAKKLKEEQDTKAKKQKEEEEAKVKEQKEEAEIKAKMQKEEKEAEAKKQKDEEAKTQKQKEEKEAKAKKLKEEQEAKAKKQKEEEAKAKKQKEEEEAKAKKLKEEEEAMAKKHKEEQDTKAKKQKEEEEEAKVKEQKEEAEIKSKKQKEETEAEAKKQKDEEEAKVKKQKEEKEAKAIKQKEEEGLRAKKLKEEQEAKAKKQKEEEEAKVKKQKEEEEAKAIKQKEEEEAMAKKLKEEQEAKAKKQKEEEEAKIKKQEEKEALKTKKLKEKQEAEAKKQKEEEEAKVKKKKEDEEAMAKKQKEEEDAMAKKLKEEKEAQAKKQKEEEAKIKKQKEEEEAKAIKQKEEAEAKKLREEQEAKEKKHKEEEEAKQNEEEAKAQKQKGEEELKVKKQKEEEEFKAKKLRDEKEAQAKKQKEEEAKIKKQKEEDEAKAIKQKEEAKSKMLKEEEEAKEKKQKQEEEVRFQKQKEEEEAKAKKQKEEEEIKAKKLKEEKEAKAKKQKKEEEAKAKKLKEEEEAKAKKQKEEEEAMAKKQKEEEDAMAKKLKEEKEAQAKKQKEEEAKIKKQKEEEEAKAIKQKEEAEAKKLREEQEAKEKKHKEEEEAKQNEEEAKAQKQKGEEEFKAKKLRDEKEAQAKKQKEEEAKIKKQKEEDEAKAIKQKKEAEAKKLKEEQEAKEKKQKEVEEAKNKKQKEEEEAKAKKQKEEAKAKKLKEEQEAKAKKQKEEEEAKAKKQAENGETKATTLTEVEENKLKKIKTKKQNEIEEAKNKAIEVDGTKVKKQKKEAKTTVQKQDREDDYENIQKKETQVIKEHELKTAKGSKTERTRVLKEIEVDENVMQEYKKFEENRQKEHIRFDKSVSDQTDEYSASSIKAKRERDILKAEDHETTNYSEGRSNIKKDTKSYQDRNVEEWVKSDSHREHKHDDGEKRKFVDHSHRDYTSEFARPSGYREKTYEADNFRLDTASKGITIYKAQTLVLDAQLRSSIPPLDMRKSEPSDRLDIKHRTKAVSEARSILSEKRSSVPRDVRRKPVFSTYLTDRTAVEGSRVKLTCSVLSSADPTITWYKNGVLIDNKLKYRTKYIDGLITLEVLNAAPVDSAEYNCTVENENGSVSTTAILKVYPSFEASPIPPTFTRSIRDNYHLAENELVLECRIRGQPLPSISWLKDDRPISTNERYQAYYLADGVCRLAISAPTPEDSGKYTCKAENSVWSDQINHVVSFTGKEAHLSPNIQTIERSRFTRQAMESRRPHFTNVLTDYKVAHGGTIGLQVEIRGCPTRVEWLREGKSVTDVYRNAKTFVEQGLYTLALSDVTEKETGLYTCRAWSTHGNVDMNAAITVVHPAEMDGKPAIIAGRPEKDVLISVGEDLNISFRVQGEPKPKVVFMKGTRDITTSQRVCKMTSDDYVKFTVKRSVISDAGTYCILARNAYGCDRAFVTVVVRQRASSENLISDWTYPLDDSAVSYVSRNYDSVPRIPSEPTVVDGGNNWVSLAWPKPDTTTPVLAYKVESWLLGKEGGARWTELGITPRNCFDVFNLKQGEQYHFRITLRNRYGWGESVQTSAAIGVGLSGGRPEFVDILPGQLKVLVGQKASLSCSVKGKPVPDVVWMKNGHEIEEDGRMIANFNGYNCSLEISDIRADDEARYSCEASNEHGRASTYARLAVVTDRLVWEADAKLKRERSSEVCGDYPPQFTMRLRDRRVQATYPVRLTCQVVGCPAPAVTWYKDGREVYKDNRHTHFKDELFHTLEIAPTTLEDGGVYEALARNSSGAVSCRCCLVVDKGIRAYVAPEFCCGLEPLYRLSEGEELRITAVVEAYPSVGVTWYRDGVRLRPSRRAVMTLDRDGQIELALAFVTSRDAGVYTCTASNEVGSASTSGKVDVLEGQMVERRAPPMLVSPDVPYSKEPMFVRKPRSSEAYEGDTVIIECEVIGDPKPDVYWLRDFLKPDYYRDATHFKRIGAGPEYRFEIPHAKLDYTGAYSVVARNVHGEAKAIISLQILAKDLSSNDDSHNVRYGRVDVIPRFERNLTDLLSYDGDAVEFECHLSGNPLPDIRWYHYAELIRDCPYLECTFEDGTARLKIKQVTADDEGTYTCEASNSLGKASSSACLVVYPPGEPNTLCQRLRRPPALLSAASTPRSTPRSTPARSVSRTRTPGPELKRLSSPGRQMPPSFYTYPFNKVVEEGETVVFQCAVKGLPSPWATWDKDGIIVTPSSRITLKEKEEIRILEIEHVTIEDVGLYRISVENDYGRAEGSARLEVITQKGKFYAGVRAYSASPRRSAPYRRRCPSNSKD